MRGVENRWVGILGNEEGDEEIRGVGEEEWEERSEVNREKE